MPVTIAFISQKGGVGKSTLARALAAVAALAKLKVRVADLDVQQATTERWGRARKENRVSPAIKIDSYPTVSEALDRASGDDLLIVDTPGHVSGETLDVARAATLVVQPTGPSLDDLHPAALVFHALAQSGIPHSKLVFALCRTGTIDEEAAARDYLVKTGFAVLPGSIPERTEYRQALNQGKALTETDQGALNARADRLLESLLDSIAAELDVSSSLGVSPQKSEGAA